MNVNKTELAFGEENVEKGDLYKDNAKLFEIEEMNSDKIMTKNVQKIYHIYMLHRIRY